MFTAEGQSSAADPAILNVDRRPIRQKLDNDIATLDLNPVSYLVAVEQEWPIEKIDAIEFEYRCFLQVARDNPEEPQVPSRDCDTYWHAHILILELYLRHCQELFGAPLLHYPFSGRFGADDAAEQHGRFEKSQDLILDLVSRLKSSSPTTTPGVTHV